MYCYRKTFKRYTTKKEGYAVLFDDGSELETNCLIVAEGINSPIRKKLLPGSRLRYSGYTCWRGVVDNSSLKMDETSETWGAKGRFGIVPMANNTVYWFACINAEANSETFRSYKIKNLLGHFKDYHSPIPQILSDTADEALIWGDINDLVPIDKYAFGNAVLIGDAAHATTPNMGQGACQAIEDAVILSWEIQRSEDIQSAFKSFENKRLKRTHFIVNRSYQIGKIAQEHNPLLIRLRNMALRLIPQKINEKQLEVLYNVDF
ncbi:MAG: FAD-dependent monooxygenase [Segetibacter sp.]